MLPPPVTDADGRRIRLQYTSRDVAIATSWRLKLLAALGIVLFLTAPWWWAFGIVVGIAIVLDAYFPQQTVEAVGEVLWGMTSFVAFLGWLPVLWYALPRRSAAAVAAYRRARGQCPSCTYALRDSAQEDGRTRCPECGALWRASDCEPPRATIG